jgi:hypothetical protein
MALTFDNLELAYQTQFQNDDPALAATIANQQAPNESYFDTMIRVANSLILADSQRRLLNVQLERAKNGLAPLNTSQYGMGVSVGLSPDVQKLLMYGGGAIVALLLYNALAKRGR